VVSLESAHRFEATIHLKRIWGDRCQVVYVDASPTVRSSRAAETEMGLQARDATKRQRGADRIADVADHVVNNAGPLSALKLAVNRLVSIVDLPRAAPQARGLLTHTAWLGLAANHFVDGHVALVLATGSTGTAGWRNGWSDLDLLVVRDCLPLDWLRRAVRALPPPGGPKVAVSAFSTADLDALRVPPRVVQALRRASHGIGVLYQRPDYLIPAPLMQHADHTSRGELGLILMTTRRLLADTDTDVRALHKHLVLLAKILLRADGCDVNDAEDVIAAFRDRHPAANCHPPALGDLTGRPKEPALITALVEATDHLLSYLDQLDHTIRTRT